MVSAQGKKGQTRAKLGRESIFLGSLLQAQSGREEEETRVGRRLFTGKCSVPLLPQELEPEDKAEKDAGQPKLKHENLGLLLG